MLSTLVDTERILQILTNAHYVETKSSNKGVSEQVVQIEHQKGAPDGEFEQYLDMDDRKIINKRKKRGNKVEECNLDLEAFIQVNKRQRLGILTHSEEDTSIDGDSSNFNIG